MTKKEKIYFRKYFEDKLEELLKCRDHYRQHKDKVNEEYFEAQIQLLKDLKQDFHIDDL